jgi:cellulose synthase/poly-beta-1,6-N-acetylglucosamine synthase-like glycosyltransferase
MRYSVVIPTVGRESLPRLLEALAHASGPPPDEVFVVNDRPQRPLRVKLPAALADRLRVLPGAGRGPASARNVGWKAAGSEWIVFLDDDVLPGPHWCEELVRDIGSANGAAAVQGTLVVPLPSSRRPTDWERQVAALASAPWITADMAYRRDVLQCVGGFDERFPRAYREDTDLALRVMAVGYGLVRGRRTSIHPVRPARWWVSLQRQAGNCDDALLRWRHGRSWRERAGVAPGRRSRHAVVTAAALIGLAGLVTHHARLAAVAVAVWSAGTADFTIHRIRYGPRTAPEIGSMVATSVLIPPVAIAHWLRGWWTHRGVDPVAGRGLR